MFPDSENPLAGDILNFEYYDVILYLSYRKCKAMHTSFGRSPWQNVDGFDPLQLLGGDGSKAPFMFE